MCNECEKKDERISALQLDNVRLRNRILAMESGMLAQRRQRLPAVRVNQLFNQHPTPDEKGVIWMQDIWENQIPIPAEGQEDKNDKH